MWRAAILALLLPAAAIAEGERAGTFDHYVLALSWNATWCAIEGDARGADQCDPRHDHGFTLHGLWPQDAVGWPSYCRTAARDPSRRQSDAMADIMGSGGLAWHQWKKHGRCSGLSAEDYFALARRAHDRVTRPAIFRQLTQEVRLPPDVVEEAFLESNPGLAADGITVTCADGRVHEVRICLDRDLGYLTCGPDVRRDCPAATVTMAPIR